MPPPAPASGGVDAAAPMAIDAGAREGVARDRDASDGDVAPDAERSSDGGEARADASADASLDAAGGDEDLAKWLTQDCKASCAEYFTLVGAHPIGITQNDVTSCAAPVQKDGKYILHCELGTTSCESDSQGGGDFVPNGLFR